MMNAQTCLAVIAAMAIVVHFICVCDRMGRRTDHRVRAIYGLVGTAAFAVALGPLYGSAPSWADAFALLAIAMFMVFDRRKHRIGEQYRC